MYDHMWIKVSFDKYIKLHTTTIYVICYISRDGCENYSLHLKVIIPTIFPLPHSNLKSFY
jgi:hypothetical protein